MASKRIAPTPRERLGAWRKDWFRVARVNSPSEQRKRKKRYRVAASDPLAQYERIVAAMNRWRSDEGLTKLAGADFRTLTGSARAALKKPAGTERRQALRQLISEGEAAARTAATRAAIDQLEMEFGRAKQHRDIVRDYVDGFGRPTHPSADVVRAALAGCEELERVEEAIAELSHALAPIRAYAERWRRGLRCVATDMLTDWLGAWERHRPTRETCLPWMDVLDDIAALLEVKSDVLVAALGAHQGDWKADGKRKGAIQMVATSASVSPSTIKRDLRELGGALDVFRHVAQSLVSERTAAAMRDGTSAVETRLGSRKRKT